MIRAHLFVGVHRIERWTQFNLSARNKPVHGTVSDLFRVKKMNRASLIVPKKNRAQ